MGFKKDERGKSWKAWEWGFSIVKTLQRHKSLPIELLAGLEGSDPAEFQPYLEDLEEAGVVEIEKDRVSIRTEPTVPPK